MKAPRFKIPLWLRQATCRHAFDSSDLHRKPDGRVEWVCWRCRKVFVASYGLEILDHGTCRPDPNRPQ